MNPGFSYRLHEGRWAVVKLPPEEMVPEWAWQGGLASVTRTARELSIVCPEEAVPAEAQAERGWACLELTGPFPFDMTGVLRSFIGPLADAGVPVFAVSTYDTDWVLVPGARQVDALAALAGTEWQRIADA